VALIHADTDVNAWYRARALGVRRLCLVHLGYTHSCHTPADGGPLSVPTHSPPTLVCLPHSTILCFMLLFTMLHARLSDITCYVNHSFSDDMILPTVVKMGVDEWLLLVD